MCRIPGQVVRAIGQDELSGSTHVPASPAYETVDGERYRAFIERGIHLAKPFSRLESTSEEFFLNFCAHGLTRPSAMTIFLFLVHIFHLDLCCCPSRSGCLLGLGYLRMKSAGLRSPSLMRRTLVRLCQPITDPRLRRVGYSQSFAFSLVFLSMVDIRAVVPSRITALSSVMALTSRLIALRQSQ